MAFAPSRKSPQKSKGNSSPTTRKQTLKQLQEIRRQTNEFLYQIRKDRQQSSQHPSSKQVFIDIHKPKKQIATSFDLAPPAPPFHSGNLVSFQSPKSLVETQEFRHSLQRSTSPLKHHQHGKSQKQVSFGLHSAKLEPLAFETVNGIEMSSKLISQPEDYFDDLQRFRQEHPSLFFRDYCPNSKSSKYSKSATNTSSSKSNETYKGGYFTVDDRYFPIEAKNPFIDEKKRKILFEEDDDKPVKISIPRVSMQKINRTFKPATRLDYDPKDSLCLRSYLLDGYAPLAKSRPSKDSEPLSWRYYKGKNKK